MLKALHIQRLGDLRSGAAKKSVYRSINKILTECMPGWDLEDRQTGLATDDAKNMLLVRASSKDRHQDTEGIIFAQASGAQPRSLVKRNKMLCTICCFPGN